jgi:hypothetical protein
MTGDFKLAALYAALDAHRLSRGLSWVQAVREMSAPFTQGGSRPLAISTVTGLRTKRVAEGDGVLQMLRWLDRTPESFASAADSISDSALPSATPNQAIRMDTRALHQALGDARAARSLTWTAVAAEIHGVTIHTLRGYAKGGRTGFPHVLRVTRWLGRPLAQFTRLTPR